MQNTTQKPYARGSYSKCDESEQWIRLSEGCPNNCEYCRETRECGTEPIYLTVPSINRNKVKIMDMNLMYKDRAVDTIKWLGNCKVDNKVVYYELICGIDWRFMTQEKADALKLNRFVNVRFAWDYELTYQMKIKDCVSMLVKAGYKAKQLVCFMICDWKIPFEECLMKLNLLKVWNVQVSDCWYDNVTQPNYQCNYWTLEQCKLFAAMCDLHNQSVIFNGIYPDMKRAERLMNQLKVGGFTQPSAASNEGIELTLNSIPSEHSTQEVEPLLTQRELS